MFETNVHQLANLRDRDFAHIFKCGTKAKIPSEIKLTVKIGISYVVLLVIQDNWFEQYKVCLILKKCVLGGHTLITLACFHLFLIN